MKLFVPDTLRHKLLTLTASKKQDKDYLNNSNMQEEPFLSFFSYYMTIFPDDLLFKAVGELG